MLASNELDRDSKVDKNNRKPKRDKKPFVSTVTRLGQNAHPKKTLRLPPPRKGVAKLSNSVKKGDLKEKT